MAKDEFDIFFNEEVYPKAADVFSISVPSVAQIKDDCIFVLDTNALLLPYVTGSQSLEEIAQVFKTLIAADRLKIPAQVAREFAKNRPKKIGEMYQNIKKKRNGMPDLSLGRFPLLENLECYKEVLALEKQFLDLKKKYHKQLGELVDAVKTWNWDDSVSVLYRNLFKAEMIVDVKQGKDEIKEMLNFRFAHQIPPGYKDSSKKDEGIGDLLIWLAILEIASQGKNVIFISGEEKNDWFHRSDNDTLYPRFELVVEFMNKSNNHAFHIIKLSELLELFGAKTEVIKEVANEERESLSRSTQIPLLTEQAVFKWFRARHQSAEFAKINGGIGDYEMIFDDDSSELINIVSLSHGRANAKMQIERKLNDVLRHSDILRYRRVYFVIVVNPGVDTATEAIEFANKFLYQNNVDGRPVDLVIGFLDEGFSFKIF